MTETSSPVVYHFISGQAFFSGSLLILLGVLLSPLRFPKLIKIFLNLLVIVGLLFVVLSGTPLPLWFYLILSAAVIFWRALRSMNFPHSRLIAASLHPPIVLIIFFGVLIEIPHHLPPKPVTVDGKKLYVIGDSISAGILENEITWPAIFGKENRIKVVNLARPGATAGSASEQAEKLRFDSGIVVLEIGGNDLFSTSVKDFKNNLQDLLEKLTRSPRTVLMLELPFPPFANRYGEAQRQLVKQFHVILIPRRYLAKVLCSRGATIDGVHLSQEGDKEMAFMISEFVHP